jgi:hypothetical protein
LRHEDDRCYRLLRDDRVIGGHTMNRLLAICSLVALIAPPVAAQQAKKDNYKFPAEYEALKTEVNALIKKYPNAGKRFALWDFGPNFAEKSTSTASSPYWVCEHTDDGLIGVCHHPEE